MSDPAPSTTTFAVATGREHRPITGSDSTALLVPPEFYVTVDDGPPVLAFQPFARFLRELSEKMARNLGEVLHHADYQFTRDPSEAESWIVTRHDCEECRAAAQRARRFFTDNPGGELLVGMLYWAG